MAYLAFELVGRAARHAFTCVLAGSVMLAACRQRPAGLAPGAEAPSVIVEGHLVEAAVHNPDVPDAAYARFGIPVSIRGHTILLLADLGADATVLTRDALDSVHVPSMFAKATRVSTLVRRGGASLVLDSTADVTITTGDTVQQYWGDFSVQPVIDTVRIGSSIHEQVVVPWELAAGPIRPFDGLLGRELLSRFDLEFDMPHNVLRLYARYTPEGKTERPRWLPKSVQATDCFVVPMTGGAMPDTSDATEEDKRDVLKPMVRRLWESQRFELPLTIAGRALVGFFDSGAAETTINSAAARALALRPGMPSMRAFKGYGETSYEVKGLDVQLAQRRLGSGLVIVSDSLFNKFDSVATKPLVAFGLQHFRDRTLFLSYSTGMMCLGTPRAG